MKLTNTLVLLFLPLLLLAQGADLSPIAEKVSKAIENEQISSISLFNVNMDKTTNLELDKLIKDYTILDLEGDKLKELISKNQATVSLIIPSQAEDLEITLVRNDVFYEGTQVYAASNRSEPFLYQKGLHYQGIIKGQKNSLVSISFVNNKVMGLLVTDKGNLILGNVENKTDQYVLYNEKNLKAKSEFGCGTLDDDYVYTKAEITQQVQDRAVGDCVRIYIEIDNDIVNNKGGVQGASDYVTGIFNQVAILYANESLSIGISEILAWDVTSPYSSTSSSGMLSDFQNNVGTFNGDIGHLVSYQASGGIAAGFAGICNSNPDNSMCFSSIDASYNNVPNYSFTVMVFAHEMGHLFGSRHTHACVWNGNATAIDGCSGQTEGSCSLPGSPSGGGTIMSYCHLTTGIDFNLGFGSQPGNVVRNSVANASCLSSDCGTPPPPPPPGYCAVTSTNQSDEWIANVTLANLNNSSSQGAGYTDYTSLAANLDAGQTYTMNMTPGYSGTTYQENFNVFIDYNGDLDFTDAGENVGQALTNNGTASISFTAPSNAVASTRMRVVMQYNAYAGACGSFQWGEVEDYTVNIGSAPASCGTPSGLSSSNVSITTADISWAAVTGANDYNVQLRVQGGAWADFVIAGTSANATGLLASTTYEFRVQANCTGATSAYSSIASFTTLSDGGGGCTTVTVNSNDFESGWGIWNDGGSDCRRSSRDASYAIGTYCFRIRDNTSTSTATTDNLDLSSFSDITVDFTYIGRSMENLEDFWIQISTDGGASYTTFEEWNRGDEFENGVREDGTATVQGPFSSTTKLRFRCDASGNSDYVYIDEVVITGCSTSSLPAPINLTANDVIAVADNSDELQLRTESTTDVESAGQETSLKLFPNPTTDMLFVDVQSGIEQGAEVFIVNMQGRMISNSKVNLIAGHQQLEMNVENLDNGMYILLLKDQKSAQTKSFIVSK